MDRIMTEVMARITLLFKQQQQHLAKMIDQISAIVSANTFAATGQWNFQQSPIIVPADKEKLAVSNSKMSRSLHNKGPKKPAVTKRYQHKSIYQHKNTTGPRNDGVNQIPVVDSTTESDTQVSAMESRLADHQKRWVTDMKSHKRHVHWKFFDGTLEGAWRWEGEG